MKTLIKYLVAALVVIMVSCDDTEQLIYEQPNSFIASGVITHKFSNGYNPQFFVKRCRLLSDSL